MTRPGPLKLARRFSPNLVKPEFLNGNNRTEYPCPICGGPMHVSPGQIQTAHSGKCKKAFKRMERKAAKNSYNLN